MSRYQRSLKSTVEIYYNCELVIANLAAQIDRKGYRQATVDESNFMSRVIESRQALNQLETDLSEEEKLVQAVENAAKEITKLAGA